MKHTLIVGGTRGIGFSTAQQLLQLGHRVTITGLSPESVDKAVTRLGSLANGVVLNLKEPTSFAATFDKLGALDNLVLAGSSDIAWGAFSAVNMGAIVTALQMKLMGYLGVAQAALPVMAANGSITFLGGAAGRVALPGTLGLAVVNGALQSATRTLAKELAPRRVNLVSPGLTDTEAYDHLPQEHKQQMFAGAAARIPVGRTAESYEVAQVVVLAVTNGFMSGAVLDVDGGLSVT
ncbi:SDR family oxidoreductase [Rhodoferax aquaticus]|uniref:SDR family oxidoreductase n=1 Tax=Rhodoferax aquaticus TaxID=2527691 RepID=A0A515ELT2_9BURK|nr:SDR family oxidoreductase [Rhodoferax aquaticus]QDL53611.1 SDR family oxidoreductase [Rhodoferax aquaticus]